MDLVNMTLFGLNIIDVSIILLLLCGGIVGMKRGVFKELVMTVGTILLVIISIVLKNPVAEFLSLKLPFLSFGGDVEGLVVINILFYQLVAFIVVFAVLSIVFNVILEITKLFEKILNFTIILGMASKFLGFIVGIIESYILMFLFCLALSYPIFNQEVVKNSVLHKGILYHTPVLSNLSNAMTEVVDEVVALAQTDVKNEKDEFNRQTVEIMLKRKLITPKYIEKLIEAGKIDIPGMNEIVEKYK